MKRRLLSFAMLITLVVVALLALRYLNPPRDEPVVVLEPDRAEDAATPESVDAPASDDTPDPNADTLAAGDDQRLIRAVDAITGDPLHEYELALLDYTPGSDEAWRVVQANPAQAWTQVSDDDGEIVVRRPQWDGIAALGVRAEGYAAAWAAMPSAPEPIEVRLEPGVVVEGRVTADQGMAIANATVRVGLRETQTGADGRFYIDSLSPGPATLRATHDRYEPKEHAMVLEAGEIRVVDVSLESSGSIVGRVLDAGTPVAGAKVVVMAAHELQRYDETRTGSDGTFRLDGLGPGEWNVMATVDTNGVRRLNQVAIVERDRETEVLFDFGPMVVVEGRITMANVPPAEAIVRARSVNAYDEQFTDAQADEAGSYALEVMAGTVELLVEATDARGTTQKKSATIVAEGSSIRTDFDFGAPAEIRGRVIGGRADESVNLYVLPEGYDINFASPRWGVDLPQAAVGHAIADNEGNFVIPGVEPGSYTVVAVAFSPEPQNGGSPLDNVRTVEWPLEVTDEGAYAEIAL